MKKLCKILGAVACFCLLGYPIYGECEPKFGLVESECGCSRTRVSSFATPLTLFYADTFCGNYEAKGTSIRDSMAGSITISSIPAGAPVKKAFLYWMTLNTTNPGGNGNFNGNPIVGDLIGQDVDPCWANADYAWAWRKEVTPWVTGNGTYSVSFSGGAYGEGASLVVLYENNAEPEQVFLIFDGARTLIGDGAEYSWTMPGFIADNPTTSAKVTYIIADGQPDAGGPLPDLMYYNGSLIDWNCTEGFDGPYWDTRTYDVTGLTPGGSTQAQCRYAIGKNNDGVSDCTTLEACVLVVSKGTCPPGVEEDRNPNPECRNPKLEIYPNPFVHHTVIKLSNNRAINGKIQIYDMTGRLAEETDENIIGENLLPGIYFVKSGKLTKKIIKLGK